MVKANKRRLQDLISWALLFTFFFYVVWASL